MNATTITKKTWLGREGEMYSILFTSSPTGKRVNVHRWLDTNEVEVSLVSGDGRKTGFQVIKKVMLSMPSQAEIQQSITEISA